MVTVKKTVRRRAPRLVGLAGAVVLSSSLSFPVMAPVAAEPTSGGTFNTVAEMAQTSGASGTLTTLGDEAPGDGGGLTYDVQSTSPEGALGVVSVMLADGQWAVPQGLPAGPAVGADGTAANDVVARTQSFVNAGGSLVSDASRPTPLSGANVRASGSAPYALVGMVLSGWDYSHTTYAADQNTQVGYRADVGQDLSGGWKPDDLAGWFHSQGRLWLNTDGSISPGDIVFFSNPLPAGQGESGSAPSQSTVFGNVYDVGIYVGNNQVVRASTGTAQAQTLDAQTMAEVALVARPQWSAPAGGVPAPADQQQRAGAGGSAGAGGGSAATPAPEASASVSSQAKAQQGPAAGAPSSNGGSVPDGASAGSQSSSGAGSSDHNEVVVGAGSSQDAKGRTSAAERPSAQSVRERWLPVTGVAIGVLSVAAILLSAGLIVLRLRRS